jgi:RimJ/RimL family protein N-acetyltransferase
MPLDIKTSRLTLRPWRETDVRRFLAIYGDEQVWRWLGASPAPLTDPEVALSRIKRWAGLFAGPCGVWAVVPHDETDPVGTVLLLHLPDADGIPTEDLEIGWHFMPVAWGKGYASEAASALLDRAWLADVNEVHAVVYPGNDRSVAVTKRIGMSDAGTTNVWYGTELLHFVMVRPAA